MAEYGCGNCVDNKFDGCNVYVCCGICKRHFAVPNGMATGGCGEIVDNKFDGYFDCGVFKLHFAFANKTWRGGMVVKR